MAVVFSKFIFWLENIIYIISFFLFELAHIPFIFLRMIVNILKVANNVINAIILILMWLVFGLFYLMYLLMKDMYSFVKILYENDDSDIAIQLKLDEDERQDLIVIYNEISDTLRAIMHLYDAFAKEVKLKKRKMESPMADEPGSFDIMEQLRGSQDSNSAEEGYRISKDLILEAWCRFRP